MKGVGGSADKYVGKSPTAPDASASIPTSWRRKINHLPEG